MFVLAVLSIGCATCPVNVFLLPSKRAVNSLKNRTTLPAAADFDPRVTLDAMLTPGEDRSRWQHSRAGAIEGYIVRVHDAGVESANCLSGTRLDAHIEVALRPDAPPNDRVIVEITPPMREWAARGFQSLNDLQRQSAEWSSRCCGFDLGLIFNAVDKALKERQIRKTREQIWRELAELEAARKKNSEKRQ